MPNNWKLESIQNTVEGAVDQARNLSLRALLFCGFGGSLLGIGTSVTVFHVEPSQDWNLFIFIAGAYVFAEGGVYINDHFPGVNVVVSSIFPTSKISRKSQSEYNDPSKAVKNLNRTNSRRRY